MREANSSRQLHPFDAPSGSSLARQAIDRKDLLSGHWDELQTFLVVAKAKSLTAAGDLLGSSHATVGRQMRRLQDVLGRQLLVLSKGGAALTPEGHQLAEMLLRVDYMLFSAISNLKGEPRKAQGHVRLSVTDGLGVAFVVPAMRRFSITHPSVSIQLKSPTNFKSLRENQTDIMVGFSPDPSPDMTSKELGRLHLLPMCSKAYADHAGIPTLANIHDHTIVDSEIYSVRSPLWREWQELVRQAGRVHHCDASITYGMFVKAGIGIGLLANYNMMEPSAYPLDLGVQLSLPLYAVALTERLESKAVRLIFDLVEQLFGTTNPWFSEELNLAVDEPSYREGYASLFNL